MLIQSLGLSVDDFIPKTQNGNQSESTKLGTSIQKSSLSVSRNDVRIQPFLAFSNNSVQDKKNPADHEKQFPVADEKPKSVYYKTKKMKQANA